MLIDIAYPQFVPNQILTDGQLNKLRTHLEYEDRITRIRLAGTGIICGLHARKLATSVEIDAGYGVPSDGDLIELCAKTTYTHWRPYQDPDRDEERKLLYPPWQAGDPATQLDIVELISAERMAVTPPAAPPAGATALTAANLADNGAQSKVAGRVLVLYLEHEPIDLKSCLVTSCDNKGRNINMNVRALLVKKTDLIPVAPYPAPPTIHRIERLGTLSPTSTFGQIRQAFRSIVTAHAGALGTGIKALFDTYAPFLNVPKFAAANPLPAELTDNVHVAQYQYDALLDFVSAYHEAASGAYALVNVCCPAGTFPRHLMLGVLDSSPAEGFRNEFAPAPLRNTMHGEIERVRGQFRRLHAMVEDLDLGAAPGKVVISPSHDATYPLGRRARPFYFPGADTRAWWRPRPRATVSGEWPWDPPVVSSLATDYAENTLLRIDGHVGQPWKTACDDIVNRRHDGNAEFSVLCSYLDGGEAEEKAARRDLAQLMVIPSDMHDLSQAAWQEFADWILKGESKFERVIELARMQEERLHRLEDASRRWVQLRDRRELHCATDALAHDYLQARGELLCLVARAGALVKRFVADVGHLPDEQLTGAGLKEMIEGGQLALADHLVAAVLAAPEDWTTGAIKDYLDLIAKVDATKALRAALEFALRSLWANLERLTLLALPRRVSEFDFELFAHFFRIVVAQSREFWHWIRALGLQIPGARIVAGGNWEGPLHHAEREAVAADWLGMQGCVLARFATVAAEYEAVRASDPSLFRNLAGVDGLEHLAGVGKGGTFVLVCDNISSDGSVLADFSLDGCLPCCCRFDAAGFCLPPLALPDVRVVTLPPRGKGTEGKPITLTIDATANDCDPNGPPPQMRIDEVFPSDRGAKLEIRAGNRIGYEIPWDKVHPGTVDRFEYRLVLTSKECEGRAAIGTVIVVFAVDPVLEGRIYGEVRISNEGVKGAIVRIEETGETTTTAGLGGFGFERIPVGDYTLTARYGTEYAGDPAPVRVEAGQTATARIDLKKRGEPPPPPTPKGTIEVLVRSAAGVFRGATVTVSREKDEPRPAPTDDAGMARFADLPPGTYLVSVQAGGVVAEHLERELKDGQTLALDVTLRAGKPFVDPGIIEVIARKDRIDVLAATAKVRATVDRRYAKYVNTFNTATDGPKVRVAGERARAGEFLSRQLTDPRVTEASLAVGYERTAAVLKAAEAGATGEDKAPYRQALTVVTAAYFDRVALANPETLSRDGTTAIVEGVKALKSAGVDIESFRSMWDGAALQERAGIGSAESISRLLA